MNEEAYCSKEMSKKMLDKVLVRGDNKRKNSNALLRSGADPRQTDVTVLAESSTSCCVIEHTFRPRSKDKTIICNPG